MNTMTSCRRPRRVRLCRSRHGIGLVELLIGLAIAASLLTATAVAVDASFKGYQVNQEQAATLQRARVGMNRILTLIRTCESHAIAEDGSSALDDDLRDGPDPVYNAQSIAMYDAAGTLYFFKWNSADQTVTAKVKPAGEDGHEQVLMRGVTAFGVTLKPKQSREARRKYGSGFYDQISYATVTVTLVSPGSGAGGASGHALTISSSAAPRKATW